VDCGAIEKTLKRKKKWLLVRKEFSALNSGCCRGRGRRGFEKGVYSYFKDETRGADEVNT